MSKKFNPINLTLPFYALPKDTNQEILTQQARELLFLLEEMGVFDQREYEPANKFAFPEVKKDE